MIHKYNCGAQSINLTLSLWPEAQGLHADLDGATRVVDINNLIKVHLDNRAIIAHGNNRESRSSSKNYIHKQLNKTTVSCLYVKVQITYDLWCKKTD